MGRHKSTGKKEEMLGWLKASIKYTETRDESSIPCTCILNKVLLILRCLSAPDATSLTYFETFGSVCHVPNYYKCAYCSAEKTGTN